VNGGAVPVALAAKWLADVWDQNAALCDPARQLNAWVHVDGACVLWAAASRSKSYLIQGFEQADSWSVVGHKTLNTPYDCGIILCRDRRAIVSAIQASASYVL
jgi:glutamate/tyrosine decarboxylase-like PLP-dependent enzyme